MSTFLNKIPVTIFFMLIAVALALASCAPAHKQLYLDWLTARTVADLTRSNEM